jgi:hypothetical protein
MILGDRYFSVLLSINDFQQWLSHRFSELSQSCIRCFNDFLNDLNYKGTNDDTFETPSMTISAQLLSRL